MDIPEQLTPFLVIGMRLFWDSDFRIQALEGDSTTIEELMSEQ